MICADSNGIDHSIEVTAETFYEAFAQALRLFLDNDWANDVQRIPAMLTVRVKQPEIEHRVRTRDFEAWLDSARFDPEQAGDLTDMVLGGVS